MEAYASWKDIERRIYNEDCMETGLWSDQCNIIENIMTF